jgi:hypothetical protein
MLLEMSILVQMEHHPLTLTLVDEPIGVLHAKRPTQHGPVATMCGQIPHFEVLSANQNDIIGLDHRPASSNVSSDDRYFGATVSGGDSHLTFRDSNVGGAITTKPKTPSSRDTATKWSSLTTQKERPTREHCQLVPWRDISNTKRIGGTSKLMRSSLGHSDWAVAGLYAAEPADGPDMQPCPQQTA